MSVPIHYTDSRDVDFFFCLHRHLDMYLLYLVYLVYLERGVFIQKWYLVQTVINRLKTTAFH